MLFRSEMVAHLPTTAGAALAALMVAPMVEALVVDMALAVVAVRVVNVAVAAQVVDVMPDPEETARMALLCCRIQAYIQMRLVPLVLQATQIVGAQKHTHGEVLVQFNGNAI